jgi:alkanesulfonate monooxygenase SsuD/methylene tetrahydromethanopterin reductase-like flavin-dependent oxidoreductase (luciferase family)
MLLDHSTSASSRLSMGSANKLKLGIFGANLNSGKNATLVPERWSGSWDDNVALAQMADEFGLEFFLPLGRWRGWGGATHYQESTFETITWAAALLALTKRITIFGTVHTPIFHPVVAAKQMVTADHAGHGRFGLNLVVGNKDKEFGMFGVDLLEHDERYVHGQEWLDIVRRLWSEDERFDFDGKYFKLEDVFSKPKPWGGTQPLLLNAGLSGIGQDFGVRNCDAFFTAARASEFDEKTGVVTPDVAAVAETVNSLRARATAAGRTMGVYTNVNVICRPTQKEAIDYYRYVLDENADWEAVDAQLQFTGIEKDLNSPAYLAHRQRAIRQFPFIGDPDRVAGLFQTLSEVGFDGIGMTIVNYLDELPFLRQEVLPRLENAGLRLPEKG